MKAVDDSRLSQPEKIILGLIWNIGDSANLKEIVFATQLNQQDVTPYLQSLVLDGFISMSEEGFSISEKGMKAIGLPTQ